MAQGKDLVVKMTINDKDFENGLVNAKAKMNDFDAKMSQAAKSIGKVAIALRAAASAYSGIENAIRSTERANDALDRSLYTVKSSINQLYTAISTGTLDGFAKDLNNVVKAAKEAYNAIDDLSTAKMWTTARINQLNAQIAEQRVISMSKTSTQAEKDEANRLISMYVSQLEVLTNVVLEKAQKASTAKLREIAGGVGEEYVSDKELEDFLYLYEHEELADVAKNYFETYATYNRRAGTAIGGGGMARMPTTYDWDDVRWSSDDTEQKYRAMMNFFKNEEEIQKYYDILNEESIQKEALAAAKLKALKTIERDGDDNRDISPREATDLVPQLAPITGANDGDYGLAIIEKTNHALEERQRLMQTNELIEYVWIKMWQDNIEEMNQYASAINQASSAFSSLASIVADDSPFKKFATMLSSIASNISSLISTYSSLVAVKSVASSIEAGEGIPFPYNLVAMAATASAIAGIIASAKSTFAGSYADGGIVPGTSYSGDKLFARVNSGEMILNRQQQAALFNGGGQVKFVIEGSQLKGVLDNYETIENI